VEIEILIDKPEHLEFIMKNTRHTVPNLLRETLLNDSSIEFVSYKLEHPMDPDSKFIIKTKGKKAKKALTDAISAIEKELADFKQNSKKSLS